MTDDLRPRRKLGRRHLRPLPEWRDWTAMLPQAEEAARLSEKARSAAARRYWDDARNSWIDGYNVAGRRCLPARRQTEWLWSQPTFSISAAATLCSTSSPPLISRPTGAPAGISLELPRVRSGVVFQGKCFARLALRGWHRSSGSNHRPFTAFPIWSWASPLGHARLHGAHT